MRWRLPASSHFVVTRRHACGSLGPLACWLSVASPPLGPSNPQRAPSAPRRCEVISNDCKLSVLNSSSCRRRSDRHKDLTPHAKGRYREFELGTFGSFVSLPCGVRSYGLHTRLMKLPNRKTKAFALEDHMLVAVRRLAKSTFASGRQAIHARLWKPQVGMIVPDLILILSTKKQIGRRKRFPLTFLDCTVLRSLDESRPVSISELCETLYAQKISIEKVVRRLHKWGLVVKMSSGSYTRKRNLLPSGFQILAIEAKLARWRDAIDQARGYKSFAHLSYIAMPENLISSHSRARSLCHANRIGILAVARDQMVISKRARLSRPDSAQYIWLINRYVGLSQG